MKRPTASQIRAFNEVAATGSFSRAAKALAVSQPAITAQVRAMEEAHDVRLFDRVGTGAELTAIGERLYRHTRQMRDTEKEAAVILHSARTLTIGELVIAAGAPGPAMSLIAAFRAHYPGVRLEMHFGNWQHVVNAVRDRKCDLGILTEAPQADDIFREALFEQSLVALIPEGHPLSRRQEVSLSELMDHPLLFRSGQSQTQKRLNGVLTKSGLRPQPLLWLESREAIYEACAQGIGIGFMFDAASTRADRVCRVKIREITDFFPEYAFCLRSNQSLRPVEAFLNLARDMQSALLRNSASGVSCPFPR
jgi:aminoethylphosphonate catabolism LysR family transcriptional regulator|uniref:LysR family transcriptional regulator n=1 Tax=Paracoccus sp. TRP TaxID=412597 RepID=UPI000225FBEE|nr:LysR family transcriptional regulator [Paracoccus sp. TRP]